MFEKLIPDFLIKFFAGPYVAGDSLEHALKVAVYLAEKKKLYTTLDLLAEGMTKEEEINEVFSVYKQMIVSSATDKRFDFDDKFRPTISLKPSNFTLSPLSEKNKKPPKESRNSIFELAQIAKDLGVELTVDMEDRFWTDFTLDLVNDLWESGFKNIGAVLQTRLKRTDKDIERIPKGMRIRLVIGIYREPPEVAYTDKRIMKERLIEFGYEFLRRGNYVEMGTHDEKVVEKFLKETVKKANKGPEDVEIQLLYGVPRGKLIKNIQSGELLTDNGKTPKVRLYTPFATSWPMATAYCRRRLMENPHMAGYVIKNIFARLKGRSMSEA